MAIQTRVSRAMFIGGQWRNAGDAVDITGYRQGAVEKMIDDGLLYFSSTSEAPSTANLDEEYSNILAETNLRLWQLEAGVIAETEGFTGWTGEAFLVNQDNVASVTGSVEVARAARLGGGGLYIAGMDPFIAAVLVDNPTSFWRLDETVGPIVDSVGINNLTPVGAPTLNVAAGPVDLQPAVTFDGVDDVLQGAIANRVPLTTAYTMELILSWAGTAGWPISQYGADGSRGAAILVGGAGDVSVVHSPLGGGYAVGAQTAASSQLSSSTWAHLVVTWSTTENSGLPRVFINGTEATYGVQNALLTSLNNPPMETLIGALNMPDGQGGVEPANFFPGSISEVAMYETALSPARILAHAQAAGLAP